MFGDPPFSCDREQQEKLVSAIIRQRDMYKAMAHQGAGPSVSDRNEG